MAAYQVYQLLTKSYGKFVSASCKRDLDPLESGNPLVVAGILNELARFFRGRLQLSVACTQTVRKVMKFLRLKVCECHKGTWGELRDTECILVLPL